MSIKKLNLPPVVFNVQIRTENMPEGSNIEFKITAASKEEAQQIIGSLFKALEIKFV